MWLLLASEIQELLAPKTFAAISPINREADDIGGAQLLPNMGEWSTSLTKGLASHSVTLSLRGLIPQKLAVRILIFVIWSRHLDRGRQTSNSC